MPANYGTFRFGTITHIVLDMTLIERGTKYLSACHRHYHRTREADREFDVPTCLWCIAGKAS